MSLNTALRGGSVAVIDLINRDNDTNFKEGDWVFSNPVVTTAHQRNTKVVITATPAIGEEGFRTIYYNRIDITEFITRLWGAEIPRVDIFNLSQLHEIIDTLNWEYSLSLTTDDFDDVVLDKENATQLVNLNIKSGSLVYLGTLQVELINVDFSKARKSDNRFRVTSDGYLRLTI